MIASRNLPPGTSGASLKNAPSGGRAYRNYKGSVSGPGESRLRYAEPPQNLGAISGGGPGGAMSEADRAKYLDKVGSTIGGYDAYMKANSGPAQTSPTGGDVLGGGGGGSGVPGTVVAPEPEFTPPSMQALMSDGGGGMDAGGNTMLSGPSRFRQGIGSRMLPQDSPSLSMLRKAY